MKVINCLFSHGTKPKRQTISCTDAEYAAAHMFSQWLQPRVHLKLPLPAPQLSFLRPVCCRNWSIWQQGIVWWTALLKCQSLQVNQSNVVAKMLGVRHYVGQTLWKKIFKCILKEYSSCVGDVLQQDTECDGSTERKYQVCLWTVSLSGAGEAGRGQ